MSILVACMRFFRTKMWSLFLISMALAFIMLGFSYFTGQQGATLESGNDYGGAFGGAGNDRSLLQNGHRRRRLKIRGDDEQTCRAPKLRLSKSAVAEPPQELMPLMCNGRTLFFVRNGALQVNETVLKGRKLDRCVYKPIKWDTDESYTVKKPFVVTQEPFNRDLKHDFFKVECYLARGPQTGRRLLQDGPNDPYLNQIPDDQQQYQPNQQQYQPQRQQQQYQPNQQQYQPQRQQQQYQPNPQQYQPQRQQYQQQQQQFQPQQQQFQPQQQQYQPQQQQYQPQQQQYQPQQQKYQPQQQQQQQRQQYHQGEFQPQIQLNQQQQQPQQPQRNPQPRQYQPQAAQQNPVNSPDSPSEPKRYPSMMGSVGLPDMHPMKKKVPDVVQPQMQNGVVGKDGVDEPEEPRLSDGERSPLKEASGLQPSHQRDDVDYPQSNQKAVFGSDDDDNTGRGRDDDVAEDTDEYPNADDDSLHQQQQHQQRPEHLLDSADRPDFEQFVARVRPRPEAMQRAEGQKAFRDSLQMNVLIIGVDSMTQLDFQTKMPETYSYLKDTLSGIVLNGYNVVGEATMGALLPMLTGRKQMENPEARKGKAYSTYLESYPFIWNKFESTGFVTLYAEDHPSRGTFQHPLNGWEEPPVDHYMRSFWVAAGDSRIQKTSQKFCLGGRPRHQYTLDYLRQFFMQYQKQPKFAMGLLKQLTHGDNSPSTYLDEDLVDLLQFLEENDALENTLLVVMGDHGTQHGKHRNTPQGKLEERLPMMSLSFPPSFAETHPDVMKNLRTNADRLTTPFDIHETLLNLVHFKQASQPVKYSSRSVSLFKEVPQNRSCAVAEVGVHWCACAAQIEARVNAEEVEQAASEVIAHINKKLEDVTDRCEKLSLGRIRSAFVVIPDTTTQYLKENGNFNPRTANITTLEEFSLTTVYYQVTMETLPNHVVYEATVLVDRDAKTRSIQDEVSRTSGYSNDAHVKCILEDFPELSKFCHCRSR